jgi:1,4-alpha-glucan branching enzyme
VAVVGDFNGWNPDANVMTADARGVWTTTVPLPPGRHAYAFVVDGTVWVTDPRAPVVRDPDYGRDQSVVLVGHP